MGSREGQTQGSGEGQAIEFREWLQDADMWLAIQLV